MSSFTRRIEEIKTVNATGKDAYNVFRDIGKNSSIFVISQGQFGACDVMSAMLHKNKGGIVHLATWTSKSSEVARAVDVIESAELSEFFLYVDPRSAKQHPESLKKICDMFGSGSVRLCSIHAKFILVKYEDMRFVVTPSMNLSVRNTHETVMISESSSFYEWYINNVSILASTSMVHDDQKEFPFSLPCSAMIRQSDLNPAKVSHEF